MLWQKTIFAKTSVSANAWDLAYASFNGGVYGYFSVAAEETNPHCLFFKPDGTKMYVLGQSGDDVNEYSLSTAWEVSTASYVQNFSVASQETTPAGLFFKDDGTKMYVIGGTGDDVNEYTLSTAWDISTASYVQVFSVSARETAPTGIFFKPDGTNMYVIGSVGDNVLQYSLSTAWDISTATYVRGFNVNAQESLPQSVFFKPDGTKMYVIGQSGDDVNEYSLSTAWDISTASFVQNFSVNPQEQTPFGLFFKDDGTRMYIVGQVKDAVYSYTLSTAWDISTASWDAPDQNYFSIAAQTTNSYGLFFKPDGTKMYFIDNVADTVNEYSLGTAWDIATSSFVQNFSVNSQETNPYSLFFKPDGTKMYVIGQIGDDVNEYSLSTAWDVSTASYVRVFSIGAQETAPTALFFKPDGTKMYVLGSSGDDVNEYSLSTAWDVSTASYVQNFSVAAQDTVPVGLFFKDDGAKMYVVGGSGDDVNEYSLSTAWDISTASYVQNFSVAAEDTAPTGIFFKDDGTKMYITGNAVDAILAYDVG